MTPVIVRLRDAEEDLLLLGFVDAQTAIIAREGGRLQAANLSDLRIERPNSEFPIGYDFARQTTRKPER